MTIVQDLSNLLLIDTERLVSYISTCPHRYKVYMIPKRNGKGVRIIAQPSKELKFLQKLVCEKYLSTLPIHNSCMAYRKNKNIQDNAYAHVKHKYVLKMDFKDFFSSITPFDLITHIENHLHWADFDEDKIVIRKLFFYMEKRDGFLKLSIGAPTSPFISNTIMNEFDSKISKICNESEITYTRYADDISFSTNKKNILFDFPKIVSDVLDECSYPRLKINGDKTVFLSRKGNIHITGLVLTNEGKISVGRSQKRYIKSLVHKSINGLIGEKELSYLSGYLSFCCSVEPNFILRLEKKYGLETIRSLRHGNYD